MFIFEYVGFLLVILFALFVLTYYILYFLFPLVVLPYTGHTRLHHYNYYYLLGVSDVVATVIFLYVHSLVSRMFCQM